MGVFQKRTLINASRKQLFDWHSRPGAIERLSPPWDPARLVSTTGGIRTGAEVVLRLKQGPVPYKWHARHTDWVENSLFRDEQIKGPMAKWVHTHRFEAKGERQCFLEDTIDYRLPWHPLSTLLAHPLVKRKLNRIFHFRHVTTAEDLRLHLSIPDSRSLKILITGSGGLIGSSLIPFLTTGGHRVYKLVRRTPRPEKNELFWDPISKRIDLEKVAHFDAVIHLAGESIGNGRWTRRKKGLIRDSRVLGTSLLAETLADMNPPPEVMINASAVGYYGDRGSSIITETDSSGNDFISEVCKIWEEAAGPAEKKGIRTVYLRIGLVLDPRGGALSRLLLPFRTGLGGQVASGNQYVSWIGLDDVIGSIHQSVFDTGIEGPLNVVAPNPVTNAQFTRTLATVLSRPAVFRFSELPIRLLFGQMGDEILLSGVRVFPEKLINRNFYFRFPDLEKFLMFVLGRTAV